MTNGQPDHERFREELARVLASDTFRGSESLRRLLSYLADAYLSGSSRQLKEYTIGRDAMGKPEDYDPRVDASVRVQAGKLRQRLEQYYREDGASSPDRLTLPKGHFELAFQPAVNGHSDPAPPSARPWPILAGAMALVALLALIWGGVGWRRASAPKAAAEGWSSELRTFWDPFLESRKPPIVVLGSPLFIRFHDQYYRHHLANKWEEAPGIVPLEELRRLLKSPTPPTETRRWTPLGEAMAAFRLAMFLGPVRPDLSLKRSTVLAWEDVKVNDLIFLGPTKFNQQLNALPIEQDFVFADAGIRNLRPRAGEREEYRRDTSPETEDIPEEYALITRMRGVEGWGEVLVLASTTTEGTWAAVEYVTHEATLRELLTRLGGPGALPDCYQAVLRCRFREQVPIRTEYVTHHVLRDNASAR